MEYVSWDDVIAFCTRLSANEGVTYRLPTEAEWEYACRAGSTTRYSLGDDEASLGEVAWYNGNSGGKTHPVKHLRPNAWGLYDMHGNVWEWCWDRYGAAYYKRSPVDDPSGLDRALPRMLRGGSWRNAPRIVRSATRADGGHPEARIDDMGFRLARVQSVR